MLFRDGKGWSTQNIRIELKTISCFGYPACSLSILSARSDLECIRESGGQRVRVGWMNVPDMTLQTPEFTKLFCAALIR